MLRRYRRDIAEMPRGCRRDIAEMSPRYRGVSSRCRRDIAEIPCACGDASAQCVLSALTTAPIASSASAGLST